MCGIACVVGGDPACAERLISGLTHRGPDDSGQFYSRNLILTHTRLSILDPSPAGHQPMATADGRYTIVFNGEIYNHREIRTKFLSDVRFQSSGDTETLLYGFVRLGEGILQHLNGIFTFVIFDSKERTLTVARDPLGVKPLYYYQSRDVFACASEIKAMIGLPDFDKSLDHEAFVDYLSLLWSPGERTPFKNVRKLLPGHLIKCTVDDPNRKFECRRYRGITFAGSYFTEPEQQLAERLEDILLKAIKRQLLSDVPVGFFLSGGLDSSGILALATQKLGLQRPICFSINTAGMRDYEGFSNDARYALLVAKHLDLDLRFVNAEVDVLGDFDKMIYHLDEPQADAAPLNVLNICRMAREEGCKVLLGGTGADDVFSGYRRHQALRLDRFIDATPFFVRKMLSTIGTSMGVDHPLRRRVGKLLSNIACDKAVRHSRSFLWLEPSRVKALLSDRVRKSVADYDPLQYFYKLQNDLPAEKSDLNRMLYWELKTFLVDHNLNYTDKMSMATSVEVRVPYLDLELVDFAARIPPDLKMKGCTTKYLLRKVMERYLPKEVVYRSKTGFGAPVREWIKSRVEQKKSEYLSEDLIRRRDIFDPVAVKKLLEENNKGKLDASYTIWGLLAVESWLRQFVDGIRLESSSPQSSR